MFAFLNFHSLFFFLVTNMHVQIVNAVCLQKPEIKKVGGIVSNSIFKAPPPPKEQESSSRPLQAKEPLKKFYLHIKTQNVSRVGDNLAALCCSKPSQSSMQSFCWQSCFQCSYHPKSNTVLTNCLGITLFRSYQIGSKVLYAPAV